MNVKLRGGLELIRLCEIVRDLPIVYIRKFICEAPYSYHMRNEIHHMRVIKFTF